jgi:two-component system, chemotaxis family, chemotaxis protein CheY
MVDKNINILIVDDYKTMLRIVRSLLNQLGFNNIDEASNGSMALVMLQEKKYDLIMSDWNMEPMSGLDLLKNIRADDQLKLIPFIMITAEGKPENIITSKEAGVNNYLVKPFNADTLKEKLTTTIGAF